MLSLVTLGASGKQGDTCSVESVVSQHIGAAQKEATRQAIHFRGVLLAVVSWGEVVETWLGSI